MKVYNLLLVIVILVVIGLGLKYGFTKMNTTNVIEQVQTVKQVDNELQIIMDEENFKKETILRARKVANDKKKAIELERSKQALEIIESEYESIRAEELLLTGDSSVSLK